MCPALDILNEYVPEDDEPLLDAKRQVEKFVKKIMKIHEPITGEAYPEDRNRYCAVCMSGDGGSRRWPCSTVKAVRDLLGQAASVT